MQMVKEVKISNILFTVEVAETSNGINIFVDKHEAEKIYRDTKRELWYASFSMKDLHFWIIVKKDKIQAVPCISGTSEQNFIQDYLTRAYSGLWEFIFTLLGIFIPSIAIALFAYAKNIALADSFVVSIVAISYFWFATCNTSTRIPLKRKKKMCN